MSKYKRTYHLPWSLGTTNDDKISKDVSNIIGVRIIITEKLDGENTGMVNDGVYARSHSTFTKSPWSVGVRSLHDNKVRGNLEDNVYLFGENMEGIHSIEYTELDSYFYLFGVRKDEIYLSWDLVEEYSFLLDIPTVPVLFDGVVESVEELIKIVNNLVESDSKFGGDIEGIVVRTFEEFHGDDFHKNVLKWVREDHVKTDEHWTRNWKKSNVKINYK